jgi:hypothetical protein
MSDLREEFGFIPPELLYKCDSFVRAFHNQLCELGYGGPRHRSRLLSSVGPRLRLRDDEAHPLLIDRFGWPCCTYPTAQSQVRTSPRFGTGDQVFRNVRLSANTAG